MILHNPVPTNMDIEKLGRCRGIAIDNLRNFDFHVWKPKFNLILTYREVGHVILQSNRLGEGAS